MGKRSGQVIMFQNNTIFLQSVQKYSIEDGSCVISYLNRRINLILINFFDLRVSPNPSSNNFRKGLLKTQSDIDTNISHYIKFLKG